MSHYRVTITGRNEAQMAELVRTHRIDVFGPTVRKLEQGAYSVDAIVDGAEIGALEESGFTIVRLANVEEVGKARQAEVGQGDRYKDRRPE